MATSLNQNEKGLWIISGISFGNCDGAIPDVPGNLKVPVTLYWPEKGQNPVRIEIEKVPKDVETTWITDMGQDKPDPAQLDRDMDSGATILGEKRYIVNHIEWCRDCTFNVIYTGGTVSSDTGKTSAFKITKAEGLVLVAYSLNDGPAQTIENDTLVVAYPANESETEIRYTVKVSATSEDCRTVFAETRFTQDKKEAPDCNFEIRYTGDTVSSAAGETNAFKVVEMPDGFSITSYTIDDVEHQITDSDLTVQYPANTGAAREIAVIFKGNSTECDIRESNVVKIPQKEKEGHEPVISYDLLLEADKKSCDEGNLEAGETVTFEVFLITLEDETEVNRENVTTAATFIFTGDSYYTPTQEDNVIDVKNEGSETGEIGVEATYEINGTSRTSNKIILCVKGKDEPEISETGTLCANTECILYSDDLSGQTPNYTLDMCGSSNEQLFEVVSQVKYDATPYTAYTDGHVVCGNTESVEENIKPWIITDDEEVLTTIFANLSKSGRTDDISISIVGDGPYQVRASWQPCCRFDYDYNNGQSLGIMTLTNDIDWACQLPSVELKVGSCPVKNEVTFYECGPGFEGSEPFYSFAITPDEYFTGKQVEWETTFKYNLTYVDIDGNPQQITGIEATITGSGYDDNIKYVDNSGFSFKQQGDSHIFETENLREHGIRGLNCQDDPAPVTVYDVKTVITRYESTCH